VSLIVEHGERSKNGPFGYPLLRGLWSYRGLAWRVGLHSDLHRLARPLFTFPNIPPPPPAPLPLPSKEVRRPTYRLMFQKDLTRGWNFCYAVFYSTICRYNNSTLALTQCCCNTRGKVRAPNTDWHAKRQTYIGLL
jgi:hypothetical protein